MSKDARFEIVVRLAEPFREGVGEQLVIHDPVENLGQLLGVLEGAVPAFSETYDESYVFAINDELVLSGVKARSLKSGDRVEIMLALSGG